MIEADNVYKSSNCENKKKGSILDHDSWIFFVLPMISSSALLLPYLSRDSRCPIETRIHNVSSTGSRLVE